MAVTPTHLATGSSTSNASSYTTASITPTANTLVLVGVEATVGTSPTPAITVTGCGLTWVQVDQTVAGARTVHVFRGMGASPSAGALTIAGTSLTSCLWSVIQYGGVDTTGTNGSGAVAQSFNSKPANTASVSVAFPTTPAAGNGGFGLVGTAVQELPTAGSGWTAGGSTSQSAPTSGLIGEHATSCPANVTASWTTSASPFVIGVEVQAAGGGPTAATAAGSITLGGTATGAPPKVDTFTDDFSTSTNWTLITGGTITGGQVVLPTTTGFSGVASVGQYSLVGSSASVKLVQTGGTSVSQTHFYMDAGGNSDVRFQIIGSTLWASYKVAGTETFPASVAYNPAVHRYLRLSESGGVITWAWSTDGISWTTLNTWTAAGLSVALIRPTFFSGYDGTGAAPASSIFDDFNIVPAAATATGTVSLSGTGAPSARPTAAGTLTLSGAPSPTAVAAATGTVTLGGTSTAVARPTTTGTLTLTGTAAAPTVAATATGAIVLAGTAAAPVTSAAVTGTITLSGAPIARAVATTAGSITLSGAPTARAAATAAGTVTLSGTATGGVPGVNTAAGTITLTGTVTARAAGTVTGGTITLSGAPAASVTATTTGTITLSGTTAAAARPTAAGVIVLAGTATATSGTTPATATGTITLGGAPTARVPATTLGLLTLSGIADAQALGALRDITLTIGAGRSRTLSAAGRSRELVAAGHSRTLTAAGASGHLAAVGHSRTLTIRPRE